MHRPSLRPATPADAAFAKAAKHEALGPYIKQIWGWDETVQDEFFRQDFDLASYYIIVANGQDIGTIRLLVTQDTIELHNFVILESHRGQGWGRMTLQLIDRLATLLGKELYLDVLSINPAQNLYRRCGFQQTGADGPILYFRKSHPNRT